MSSGRVVPPARNRNVETETSRGHAQPSLQTRPTARNRRSVWVVAGVVAILALLLLVGLGNVVGAPTQGVTAPDPVRSVAALTLPTLGDGLAINIAVGVVHSLLRDSITWGPGVGSHRSYTVTVTATMALPAVDALLTTVP